MALFASTEWIHSRSLIGEERVLTLNRIQTKIAISHLWVEEYVTGDVVDLDEIQDNLDSSTALLTSIGKQAKQSQRLLNQSEHVIVQETLAQAMASVMQFTRISKRRIAGIDNAEDVGIGSSIDEKFDAVFATTLSSLRSLEHVYQSALERNESRSQLMVRAIVIAWLLIVTLAVGGLWHRARREEAAERALLESESRLLQSQKMDAVGRLAGGIAHDINNHLAAITMQCEVVKLRAAEGDPIVERMDSITAIGAKSADLIQRLLAFSRRQPVQPEVFRVQRVVFGMQKMLESLIGEDIQLQVDCNDGVWSVQMDPSQLEQILLNLIINARDAMPAGGRINVTVENLRVEQMDDGQNAIPPGDYISLTVSDQGSGIPVDIADKIFEPYFTTKDQSTSSGLGLATVHGIVTQNRGHIRLDSAEGQGATFQIYLVRSGYAETEEVVQSANEMVQAAESIGILLVEDNQELCAATQEILHEFGYIVIVAADGEEALTLFDNNSDAINLVITDIVMPGIGGKELADRLRKRQPSLPILFVSGYNDDVMLRHGVEAGGVDFLAKPFTATDLANTVQNVLNRPGKTD